MRAMHSTFFPLLSFHAYQSVKRRNHKKHKSPNADTRYTSRTSAENQPPAQSHGRTVQVGDHLAALRILALVVGDMDAAEDYCGKHAGPDGYLTLLDMLLRPGDARPPLFMEACHLLAAQGNVLLSICCSSSFTTSGTTARSRHQQEL